MSAPKLDLQAVILATGETSKLIPLAARFPSPMVPVANRPVMSYAIEVVARQGVAQAYVCVYDRAASVESYFHERFRWGMELTYVLQREPLGTAGSIKLAQRWLCGTFLVFPADILLDLDLAAALAHHRTTRSEVTAIVHSDQQQVPTGAYLMEAEVLLHIPPKRPYDISEQLLPRLEQAERRVTRYVTPGVFKSLASFEEYHAAQAVFLDGQTPLRHLSPPEDSVRRGVITGRKTTIAPGVRLTPPVIIGENCRISAGVELGPGTVIGRNVVVDNDATISNSTVLDDTYVGQLVHLDQRVVSGDLVVDVLTGADVRVADDFILGYYKKSVGQSLRRMAEASVGVILLMLLSPLLLLLALLCWVTMGAAVSAVAHSDRSSSSAEELRLLRFNLPTGGRGAWLGRLLEDWELHRLPELWNVVAGQLRLVGVKPLLAGEAAEAGAEVWGVGGNGFQAGFTGIWYVEAQKDAALFEILVTDAYYVATRSWLADLRLLVQTPIAWVARIIVSKSSGILQSEVNNNEDLTAIIR